jgi:hypothetical protein
MTMPSLLPARLRPQGALKAAPLPSDDEHLERREKRLAERERLLDEKAKRLQQRERDLLDQQDHVDVERIERRTNVVSMPLTDAARKATAAAIIEAGKKRRGETDDGPPLPDGIAGEIIAAGMLRRGEISFAREPRTERQRAALSLLRAARRARGEDVE